MPSNTAGGFPYPLATEPTRDGAAAIQALATETDHRLGPQAVVSFYAVGTFDSNGLWYAPAWSTYGVTWTAVPQVVASASTGAVGGDAGVHVQVYRPQSSTNSAVLQANYVKDGRGFVGNIDLYVIAIGTGKRT
jgi:hypothetical protein